MSKLPWLRLYTDTVDNEKIRLLAFEDRWHFIALLCLKQQGILDENNDLLERKIAVKLGVQLRELDEVKRRLNEVGLIHLDWQPIGWENKQYKSDSSSDRVRKHRENKKKDNSNVTETLQKRKSNVLDTESETDTNKETDKKNTKKFTPPSVDQVRQYIEDKGYSIDPQKFVDHYETSGWMRGSNKIKSWEACVRTWASRDCDGAKPKQRKML